MARVTKDFFPRPPRNDWRGVILDCLPPILWIVAIMMIFGFLMATQDKPNPITYRLGDGGIHVDGAENGP